MKIVFDPTNLLAAQVHRHGLEPSEIKRHTPEALEALRGFRALYQTGQVGFPDLPSNTEMARQILEYAGQARRSYDTVCLVGIGGSALGAWALDCALRGPHPVQPAFSPRNPRLVILDNVDPSFVSAAIDSMNPKKTLVLVISKQGDTTETLATFLILRKWLTRKLGSKAGSRIAAVTGIGNPDLYALTKCERYQVFEIPGNVGGRFSVLSPVGLLPAALIGLDIRKLLAGAAGMTHLCWQANLKRNIALRAALLHYLIWTLRNKTIHVAFPYSNRLWGTAFWFRQLWAESLGKIRRLGAESEPIGQTPVAALGATDQHSQVQLYIEGPNDKVFTFWAVGNHPDPGRIPKVSLGREAFDRLSGRTLAELLDIERRATAAALTDVDRPNCTFTLERVDEENLGAFLQLMEFQTAFMGQLLKLDAFNQPGVRLVKDHIKRLMNP